MPSTNTKDPKFPLVTDEATPESLLFDVAIPERVNVSLLLPEKA